MPNIGNPGRPRHLVPPVSGLQPERDPRDDRVRASDAFGGSAALRVLDRLLAAARAMAYAQESHDRLARVLDLAEHLAVLLTDDADGTGELQIGHVDLADVDGHHPAFARVE